MNSYSVKARALIFSAAMLFAAVGIERTSADPGKPVADVRAAEQTQQDQKASANGQGVEACGGMKAGSKEPDDRSKEPDPPTSPSESAAEQRQRGKDVFKDIDESARRTTLCATIRVRK